MRQKLWLLILFSLLLFLQPFLSVASSYKLTDSLEILLPKTSGEQKLLIYRDLIKNYRNIDPARGIELSRPAIHLADSLNNNPLKAAIINETGVCYRKLSVIDKSLEMHFDALALFERENDSMGVAFSYANIGMAYYFFQDYENALEYHFRSLLIKEYLGDQGQIAYSQNAIGMVLAEMGDYARALDYYISALAIQKKLDKRHEIANIYGNLSKVFSKLGRLNEALEYFKKAEEVLHEIGSEYGYALTLNEIANIYLLLNDTENAINKVKNAETLGLKLNNLGVLHYNYRLQAKIYDQIGDHQQAYDYLLKSANLKDSLFSEQRNREITETQVRYETERIDSENKILLLSLAEQQLRIRFLIAIIASTLLLFIIFFFIWRQHKNNRVKKQLRKLNASLEQRVIERTKKIEDEIHEKQQALNSLRKSEEKFRAISEASPLGIAVSDHHGRLFFVNLSLMQQTGIPKDYFFDGSWLGKVLIEDRQKVETLWENAHKQQTDSFESVFRLRSENNEIIWIHLKASSMLLSGTFIGMVSLLENITRQKNFEEELIKAKNKAEESDRVKSAFLANMSHEIRTPMNAILGFSDLLSSDDYGNQEKIEFVNLIKSSGRLLLNLINDIIDISKIEAGELKIQKSKFSPESLMLELYHSFKQQLENMGKGHIQLILEQPKEAAETILFTDRLRLHQIVSNLLNNAIKFTDEGYISYGFIIVNGHLQFYVKDSGIGIPESKMEIIFERFRQADDSHSRLFGGTGLGLAIVKNLVDMLGGTVWVESIHGKGTIFYFTLPTEDAKTLDDPASKPQHTHTPYPDFSDKTILIAEDNEANYLLLKRMLAKTKANILYAHNGLIATDMAASTPSPDLILMDIQMPEMNGIEAMKNIRKHGFRMPSIAVTAFTMMDEEKEYVQKGFDAYLQKPLGAEKLFEALQTFLR
jgi:PAS domain S-box-containing protein